MFILKFNQLFPFFFFYLKIKTKNSYCKKKEEEENQQKKKKCVEEIRINLLNGKELMMFLLA